MTLIESIKLAKERPDAFFWQTMQGELSLVRTFAGEYSLVEEGAAAALGLRIGNAVAFHAKTGYASYETVFAQGPEAEFLIQNFKEGTYMIRGKWICGVQYSEEAYEEDSEDPDETRCRRIPRLLYGILLTDIPVYCSSEIRE